MSAITEFPNRRYYSISEVSDHFKVSNSLLRYWEKEFTSLTPHKNSKGERRFTSDNIQQVEVIFNLVKRKGFTLKGAQNHITSNKRKIAKRQKIVTKLQEVQMGLKNLMSNLN